MFLLLFIWRFAAMVWQQETGHSSHCAVLSLQVFVVKVDHSKFKMETSQTGQTPVINRNACVVSSPLLCSHAQQ